eukprot:SAG31_NODE_36939_length_309_cov_0.576190_1_plen_59_part_01
MRQLLPIAIEVLVHVLYSTHPRSTFARATSAPSIAWVAVAVDDEFGHVHVGMFLALASF